MSSTNMARDENANPFAELMKPFIPPMFNNVTHISRKREVVAVPTIDALNHDILTLVQKQMELVAIYQNIWLHTWNIVLPPANQD